MEKIPPKAEIFNLVNAQSETLDVLSQRLVKVEDAIKIQDSKNQTVIVGVLIATVLIVVTVAAEVIISNKGDQKNMESIFHNVQGVREKQIELDLTQKQLEKNLDQIKTRNPYLK